MVRKSKARLQIKLAKNYRKPAYMSVEAGIVGLITFLFGYKSAYLLHGALPFFGGIWCMTSALVVLFAFVDSSIASAKTRIISSIIGCIIATLFCCFLGASYFTMFLAVSLTVFISLLFGYEKGTRISSCVAAVIVGIGILAPTYNPLMNALLRLSESVFGICVGLFAVFISYLIKIRTLNKKH